ncbi:hypothetical protein ACFSX9_10835 [Flavobacterium ardleyense]|uniref:Uncharacterized protein n=1 Tax=Flavobacterium ardleyense TaxID=2038737 RepID=A0ABW5Z9R7_9FLAO
MSLEKKIKEDFIKGLKLIVKQGYNPEIATKYAFDFYLNNKITDKILYEVVEDIMIIDSGPEFVLTEKELITLVKDKLNINISEIID